MKRLADSYRNYFWWLSAALTLGDWFSSFTQLVVKGFVYVREKLSQSLWLNNDWYKIVGLLLLFTTLGCGGTGVGGSNAPEPPKVPVGPVTGKILFGREIPVGARVSLVPISRQGDGPTSTAIVQSDGTFKISSYGNGDGAPPGEYAVLVQWFKLVTDEAAGSGAGPNVLPKEYSSPTDTPFKITVKAGSNDLAARYQEEELS